MPCTCFKQTLQVFYECNPRKSQSWKFSYSKSKVIFPDVENIHSCKKDAAFSRMCDFSEKYQMTQLVMYF